MRLSMIVCIAVAVIMTLLCCVLAVKSVILKKKACRLFALTSISAAVVTASYWMSVFAQTETLFSVLSSVYFASIDMMLLGLFAFAYSINGNMNIRIQRISAIFSFIIVLLDMLQLLANTFTHHAFTLNEVPGLLPRYEYVFTGFYYIHLVLSYSLIVLALICFIAKSRRMPKEYRGPYNFSMLSIMLIVLVNAVFLFIDGDEFINRVDVSTLTYGVTIALIYWSFFQYSNNGMLKIFKNEIFDGNDRAIVVFDYEHELMLRNRISEKYFDTASLRPGVTMKQFADRNNLAIDDRAERNRSMQISSMKDRDDIALRCDYKVFRNSSGAILGYLLMFTDAADDTDLLTGFHNWESFRSFVRNNPRQFGGSFCVAVFDINALNVYNNTFGRDAGDRKIKELSLLMKKHFSESAYFVRGHEARLIVICSDTSENVVRTSVKDILSEFDLSLQYALHSNRKDNTGVISAIKNAEKAMMTKKLQDGNSARSELLGTLVKALEECDGDTKNHVQRTRSIGAELGKRLELSDIEQSNLSLLCLLHDIGKIGIPLEILNKPGKLNDEEWRIMKTHTEKGYQIAASSKDLNPIADMVLHHHERWDGRGYPDGLSKESIPMLARMISVIDSYDAMVSDRVYRPAMSVEDALAELKRCAGTQFDPHIVAEFIAMMNEKRSAEGYATEEYNAPQDTESIEWTDNNASEDKNVTTVLHSRYMIDDKLVITDVDEMFEKMTGYSPEEVKQKRMTQLDLIPESDRVLYVSMITELIQKKGGGIFEHRLQKKNGECEFVLCVGQQVKNELTGEISSFIFISSPMNTQAVKAMLNIEQTKAKKRFQQWETQYRSDPLTGLLNRVSYSNDIELQLISKHNKILMLMLDIDNFKSYNDTYGHQKGDELLIYVAQALSGFVGEGNYVCRMGGDEFSAALVFKNTVSDSAIYSKAIKLFDRLVSTVGSSMPFSGLSMGAMISNDNHVNFKSLYEETDKLLYIAKNSGKNRICCGNEYGDSKKKSSAKY